MHINEQQSYRWSWSRPKHNNRLVPTAGQTAGQPLRVQLGRRHWLSASTSAALRVLVLTHCGYLLSGVHYAGPP